MEKICPICGIDEENQNHLFLNCQRAMEIWNLFPVSPWKNNLNQVNNVIDWLETLDAKEGKALSDLSKGFLNCWHIWNNRNNKVFRSLNPMATSLAIVANIGVSYLQTNCKKKSNGDHTIEHPIKWFPPPHGCIKLNCDGYVLLLL